MIAFSHVTGAAVPVVTVAVVGLLVVAMVAICIAPCRIQGTKPKTRKPAADLRGDMRMTAIQTASLLQELISQGQQIAERIDMKREQLRTTVRLFDKTLAIVTENHGAEWLANQGIDNISLAAQNPVFVELGAYGDGDGPVDEYVKSQLRA